MADFSPADDLPPSDAAELCGAIVSLGFWGCLLLAAVVYAAATISTGYVEHQRLAARFATGGANVRRIADQVDRYERYCNELANSTSVSLLEAPTARTMPVDVGLQFRLDESATAQPIRSTDFSVPPAIMVVSRSAAAQRSMILAATLLVLFAFSMLVESDRSDRTPPRRPAILLNRQSVAGRLRQWSTRYRASAGADGSCELQDGTH